MTFTWELFPKKYSRHQSVGYVWKKNHSSKLSDTCRRGQWVKHAIMCQNQSRTESCSCRLLIWQLCGSYACIIHSTQAANHLNDSWHTFHSNTYVDNVIINTLRPRKDGRHFPDDIFKWIFLNEFIWISIEISLKFVPRGPINNIPALVLIMAWRRPGDKPLSEPMMVSLLTHIRVTRPQWVNCNSARYKYWNWCRCIQRRDFAGLF